MTGEWFINNKDAYTNWKATLIEGSYANLLVPAPPKEPVENSSFTTPGVTIIPSTVVDERTVQLIIDIACTSRADFLSKYSSLVSELNSGIVAIKVTALKTIYNMCVVSYMNLSAGTGLKSGKLTVRMREPDPTNRTYLS